MADKKKTMNASVFERLAKRFSECRKEINRDKVISDGDIPNVMFTAGETLFVAISSKELDLRDTPKWFAIKPKGTSPHHGNICHSWDLYWLTAIEWLSKNKPESGITFPGYILHRVSLKERLYSGLDIYDILYHWHKLSDEHFKRAWRQLATASEDACSYLVGKDFRGEKPAERKQNRKTTIVAIIISLILDLVFELLVYFVPFTWVKNHPNSYGLQGSIIFLIPCLIVGFFKPQYRKWCWGVGAIAFIVLLLSLMGGPSDINVN